ncbi:MULTISPECIES: FadR/GntR family transcriptional regulator [Paenibacillus]|uniref:HTH-type transcriptional regulator LutR n=1 Tax=Paenibacillus naphthalenovorans TaxID=162209 RepID=A0A0U2W8G9_9BACL|nr:MULTISPECIES: FadR/GntR family transcriptional regulator [Paenibacillus]ALS23709.1 HTH-type transcriptional regulator LutR [Paenibacillus naphthalenovorans]NTZ19327.1 FadR family transcriptional regulator [Paenibacillus sp. JMULE4]GCL73549.1 FadR family transcriptional regulator [Paenibacillus naphthalenovorans]SDJ36750.1 GntR family transcriptional regulator, transcriptional repressor for pyruvate dehydrogenase complex [Paenibacillus naphthalenovorans]
MNYAPIKKQKVHEIIIGRIKESIESGKLKPGDKLPAERELAAMFSVSRGPIREAISVLASKGIITVKPGSGIFLNHNDDLFSLFDSILNDGDHDIFELLELRIGVESYAAFFAAQRRTEEELKRIKSALDQMESSIKRGELAVEEDFAFHTAIIEASHNSLMINTFKLISDMFIRGVYQARIDALKIPGKTEEVFIEHRLVYEAILASDPEMARKAMADHIGNISHQLNAMEEI